MILYFSGTGNSRAVAMKMGEVLSDRVESINEMMINSFEGEIESPWPFVLVVPAYAWRIPAVVEKFVREHEFSGSGEAYVVMTCGSSVGAAGRYAQRLFEEKGMKFRGLRHIVMPENYIALFSAPDAEKAEELVDDAMVEAEKIAEEIRAGKDISEPIHGIILSSIVNWFFYRFVIGDRKFHIEGECIGCGKCARLCPMKNISMDAGHPEWKGNCTHCMSCINICVNECIEYGRSTQKKRRYYLK